MRKCYNYPTKWYIFLRKLPNVATSGALDSLQRLIDENEKGTLFALVQDGLNYPEPDKLELAARLPKPATIFVLGAEADNIHYIGDIVGMRMGIGPPGSGTALFVKEAFDTTALTHEHMPDGEYAFNPGITRR